MILQLFASSVKYSELHGAAIATNAIVASTNLTTIAHGLIIVWGLATIGLSSAT